jgi:hypothetical protein
MERSHSKKNIIYNYNYIKKDKDSLPSKRALVTLPVEPYRM